MADSDNKRWFSKHIQTDIDHLKALTGHSPDIIVREMVIAERRRAALVYIDGMVDKQALQDSVIAPLYERMPRGGTTVSAINETVLEAGEVRIVDECEAVESLLSGQTLLLLDGEAQGISIALQGWEDRAITESQTQTVVRGPQNAFTETIRTNTTLIRRRVKDVRLRLSSVKVGTNTKTDVAIMYMEGLANNKLVETLKKRLSDVKMDGILEGEYLEEILIGKRQITIFPTFYNSDRPDTIAAGIMEGKIALIVDGTPFVLLAPTLFIDFLQSAEDFYQSFIYSSAIRLLRYLAMLICMLAPSIYIALTTFHQEMLPTQLLISLAAQREGVPFPAFVEALMMEVTFEILREAGVRMPRTIGQAVSIVGTIVIGQAAVEASIVSAAMVIIVAITAISSFVIPSYAMSVPIRLIRFVFMAMAAAFGVYGLTVGIIILVIHLCNLNSFGMSYMSPLAPYNPDEQKDSILRFPLWLKGKKPKLQE